MPNKVAVTLLLGIVLASGIATALSPRKPHATTPKTITLTRQIPVSEKDGWKQVVTGYWTKVEKTSYGPITSTFIDHSSKAAVRYEIALQEKAKRVEEKRAGVSTLPDNEYLASMKKLLTELNAK